MQKDNIINSLTNNKITELIKIRDYKKYRDDKKLIFLEGERLINDTKKEMLVSIFVSENYDKDLSKYNDIEQYIVSNKVFNKIKDTKTSQGIIALARIKINTNYNDIFDKKVNNVLLLDNIQDPGNLGTIFRTCEASDIKYIVLTKDCCDAFMPKVLRSSMSSVFRVNLYFINDYIEFLDNAKTNGYRLISTTLCSKNKYYDFDYTKQKNIIVFGNEANGIRKDILDKCDDSITIPMSGSIESLNVSISCALVSYEIKRQMDLNE